MRIDVELISWIVFFITIVIELLTELGSASITTPLEFMDHLKDIKYDRFHSPKLITNKSVQVELGIYIESLSSIQATTMDYSMDIYLQQSWDDSRLKHNNSIYLMTYEPDLLNAIWHPDVYFSNSKSASYQYVTVPNMMVRIYNDGKVYLSHRVTITASCMMNLANYPMDAQNCTIRLLSYSYTIDMLNFSWERGAEFMANPEIQLPEFKLTGLTASYCNGTYPLGVFSCLEGIISLQRLSGYHIFQTYLPSGCIVCISWITFWIHPEAVPARVTLSITTLLTLATQSSGIRSSLPPVSYTKAIDVWMGVCVGFIVAALLEFTSVNMLYANQKQRQLDETAKRNRTLGKHGRKNFHDTSYHESQEKHEHMLSETCTFSTPDQAAQMLPPAPILIQTRSAPNGTTSTLLSGDMPPGCKTLHHAPGCHLQQRQFQFGPSHPGTGIMSPLSGHSGGIGCEVYDYCDLPLTVSGGSATTLKNCIMGAYDWWEDYAAKKGGGAMTLDHISRYVFPSMFLAFNLYYWLKYNKYIE